MRTLTWKQVRRRRLFTSALTTPVPASGLVRVAEDVCGIHAQVMTSAELALGVRVEGIRRADVRKALWEDRSLVKTWTIRGTLHLHPAAELPLWLAAGRARPARGEGQWAKDFGVTLGQVRTITDAIGEALDGQCLTREELAHQVAARAGSWARAKVGMSWGVFVGQAAADGLLCFGPSQGSKVTFVRPDQWIGRWEEQDPHVALAEVARRYLRAYGPAHRQDFAQWLGLPPGIARTTMDSIPGLVEVAVEGYGAWLLEDDAEGPWDAPPGPLRLIPTHDAYAHGSFPRDRWIPEPALDRVFYRGGGPPSLVLVDGLGAGLWDRRQKGKRLEIGVEELRALTANERRQLEAEASLMGGFLGLETTVAWGARLRKHPWM